jgi:FtsH-binding integral membrane protein
MSDSHEMKIAAQHNAPLTGQSELHEHPVNFNSYLRRCLYIFIAILCAISLMVWISYLPANYSWTMKAGLILTVAGCNAFLVAGFLMHLLSEKKMIYTILGFTVFFVIGLFWLTLYAMQDFPSGTQMH